LELAYSNSLVLRPSFVSHPLGAPVNVRNAVGEPPIICAYKNFDFDTIYEVTEVLLEHGARVHEPPKPLLCISLIAVTQSTNSMPRQPHMPKHGDYLNSPWRIMLRPISVCTQSLYYA